MGNKTVRLLLSEDSIDNGIKKLKELKKQGYTTIGGIDCDCWHDMCDEICCWDPCACATLVVS